ncbi:urease accessory protein UreF [Dinoroseobacter sp. S76]|uniref:urease accessory protein UreF n=1 Tax=Dinoroseobacter sp. S76 TaxID=3415124 RepID=UPI003C7A1BE8
MTDGATHALQSRLSLAQWLSPGFPVSAYAYSHGLEQAIAAEQIRDAASLTTWLEGLLSMGSCQTDGVLVARAAAGDPPEPLAEVAEALATSAERWTETRDQGAAFIQTTNALCAEQLPPLPYPVAVGIRARSLGLPPEEVVALYLQAFLGGLVSGAVRLIPLGQTEGQQVSQALHPVISAEATRLAELPLAEIATSALQGDLAAMAHETQDVRIFRT